MYAIARRAALRTWRSSEERLFVSHTHSESWLSLCAGLPVIAGSTPNAGRGLYALVDLDYAATVFTAKPVVCTPASGTLRSCPYCLRPLPGTQAQQYCSERCSQKAAEVLPLSLTPSWTSFTDAASRRGFVYPLLAARIALGVENGAFTQRVLEPLCYARGAVTDPPLAWKEEHRLLLESLRESGHDVASWMTVDWYASVLARLHLNSFRVDIPRVDMPLSLDALAQQAQNGSGTAVYMLPSLLNHSCDPNIDAVWRDGDATLTLAARRDIAAGEELNITYIDAGLPATERRQLLLNGYGFVCMCPACVDELGDDA